MNTTAPGDVNSVPCHMDNGNFHPPVASHPPPEKAIFCLAKKQKFGSSLGSLKTCQEDFRPFCIMPLLLSSFAAPP